MSSSAAPEPSAASAARVVFVTAPDLAVARRLARELVGGRIAACVNLVEGLTSIYRWKGAVEEEREVLLVVKTSAKRVPALEAHLARHHPYEVPECVALEPASVAPAYLAWLLDACAERAEG